MPPPPPLFINGRLQIPAAPQYSIQVLINAVCTTGRYFIEVREGVHTYYNCHNLPQRIDIFWFFHLHNGTKLQVLIFDDNIISTDELYHSYTSSVFDSSEFEEPGQQYDSDITDGYINSDNHYVPGEFIADSYDKSLAANRERMRQP
jgi:hypothetical protein